MKITARQLRKMVRRVIKEQYQPADAAAEARERDDYDRGRSDALSGYPSDENGSSDYLAGYDHGIDEERRRDDREEYGV